MVARGWEIEREVKARYGSSEDAALAAELGITLERLQRLAQRLCLSKDKAAFPGTREMPRWDEVEEAHLKDNYGRTPNIQLARELGRSVKAVTSKAHQLGLSKDPARLEQMGRQNIAIRYGKRYNPKPHAATP